MNPDMTEFAQQKFQLKYDGDRAALGQFDAYELSEALIGFADLLKLVGAVRFGSDIEVRLTVTPFEIGSFDVQYYLHLLSGDLAGLFYTAAQVPDAFSHFVKLLAEVIELFKHLKGEKPKSVDHQDGGVRVENNNGIINYYSIEALNIVTDPVAGRATEKFVGRPLAKTADKVDLGSVDKMIDA
jgi:hypothetical protein